MDNQQNDRQLDRQQTEDLKNMLTRLSTCMGYLDKFHGPLAQLYRRPIPQDQPSMTPEQSLALLTKIKQTLPQALDNLISISRELDQISNQTRNFQNLVLVPNFQPFPQAPPPTYNDMMIDLISRQRNYAANSYDNMVTEQIIDEENRILEDMDVGEDVYGREDEEWRNRMHNLNVTINRCVAYARNKEFSRM